MWSMTNNHIRIYVPYFNQDQLSTIDPLFTPLDNQDNPCKEQREYYLFKFIQQKIPNLEADYIGLFSPKYSRKSLISAKTTYDYINHNPGYAVYLFNPYPYEDYIFYNIWEHGEFWHPGITELTQQALQENNSLIQLHELSRSITHTLFCNYWVGSKVFWREYMDFLQPVAEWMLSHQSEYLHPTPYALGPTPIFPFIIERLFTPYLMHKQSIKYLAYQHLEANYQKLVVNEQEKYVYEKIGPTIKKLDNDYGYHWPADERQRVKQFREQFFKEADLLGCSKQLRF
jgi:hypothetical protein